MRRRRMANTSLTFPPKTETDSVLALRLATCHQGHLKSRYNQFQPAIISIRHRLSMMTGRAIYILEAYGVPSCSVSSLGLSTTHKQDPKSRQAIPRHYYRALISSAETCHLSRMSFRKFTSTIRLDSSWRPTITTNGSSKHKYNGKYYFSYSTDNTHLIACATSDSPVGPFEYQGHVLEPVLGWMTHHSIVLERANGGRRLERLQ